MTPNVGRIDQYFLIIIGLALIAYIVKDGALGAGWLVAGSLALVLTATSFFSYRPLYTLLGIGTLQKSSAV